MHTYAQDAASKDQALHKWKLPGYTRVQFIILLINKLFLIIILIMLVQLLQR